MHLAVACSVCGTSVSNAHAEELRLRRALAAKGRGLAVQVRAARGKVRDDAQATPRQASMGCKTQRKAFSCVASINGLLRSATPTRQRDHRHRHA